MCRHEIKSKSSHTPDSPQLSFHHDVRFYFKSDVKQWKFLGSRSGLYGERQYGSSSGQEAVANIVLGCILYSPSSIPVPQGISERGKTPQTDIMKAKMCQQMQTLSPQFFHFWKQTKLYVTRTNTSVTLVIMWITTAYVNISCSVKHLYLRNNRNSQLLKTLCTESLHSCISQREQQK